MLHFLFVLFAYNRGLPSILNQSGRRKFIVSRLLQTLLSFKCHHDGWTFALQSTNFTETHFSLKNQSFIIFQIIIIYFIETKLQVLLLLENRSFHWTYFIFDHSLQALKRPNSQTASVFFYFNREKRKKSSLRISKVWFTEKLAEMMNAPYAKLVSL